MMKSPEEIWSDVDKLLNDVSHKGYTIGIDYTVGRPKKFHTTFPKEWVQEYIANSYIAFDPVIIWGLQNDGIRNWNELHSVFGYIEFDLISRARMNGFRNGTCIAFTFNRRKAVIGITHVEVDLPPGCASDLISQLSKWMSIVEPEPTEHGLTDRQIKVLDLLAQGLTAKDIANKMGVTVKNIQNYEKRICENLGAKTILQAVLIGYKLRIF